MPLEDGAIDVHDLSPALLGIADIFEEINKIVTGGEVKVTVRIKAGFKKGSFGVDLELARALYDRFLDVFNSRQAIAWSTFFALFGIGGGIGLIQLVKLSRGKRPTSIVQIEHTEKMKITFEGQEPTEVHKDLWRLFNNSNARSGFSRFVRPLKRKGMDSLTLQRDDNSPVSIRSDESNFFVPAKEHENETITESERILRIVSMSFREGYKWRVSEGASTFTVTLLDAEFIQSVKDARQAFSASDILRVLLRTRQWYEGEDLRAEFEIIKVYEHTKRSSETPKLDFPDG